MAVATLRAPVYFLTGLALIFYILVFAQQTDGAPSLRRRPLLLTLLQLNSNVSTGIQTNIDVNEKSNFFENIIEKDSNEASNKLARQTLSQVSRILSQTRISDLFAYFIDVFAAILQTSDNILNSRTNNKNIDNFMISFNNLITSRGVQAINVYYQIFSNIFVPIDAIAQFVRGIENRVITRKDEAEASAQALAEESPEERIGSDDVRKKKLSFNDVRTQLDALKNNINTWICSQAANMAEEGVNIKRSYQARNIDCSSLIDLDYIDEEEQKI